MLATLVLLFAFQGKAIEQPLIIAAVVPITVRVLFNSALAYWLSRRVGKARH